MKLLTTLILMLFCLAMFSQDFTGIVEKKKFSVSGGISTNYSFYTISGSDARRDPFGWQLNANLNFRFFETWDVPFSLSLSKNNYTYNQPAFNIIGISPKYKAVILHIGYRSMQFSSYSLSGLTFYGLGIDIKPKESVINCSAMYGRFSPSINFGETKDGIPLIPAFERWGSGAKISVGRSKNKFDFIFFKAKDIANSLDSIPKGEGLTPAENVVVGLSSGIKPLKNMSVKFEYTISAFTSNINQEPVEYETYTYANNFGFLLTPRISTGYFNALNTKINYKIGVVSFGVSYKRVDPGYKSLGSTYLTNDLEDYLINGAVSILNNKMNISGSIGKQRNNLDKKLLNTTKRFIGSLSLAWSVSNALNVSGTYSNFNSNSKVSGYNFADSIKYFQASNNAGISLNYNFGNEILKQSIITTYNYQIANTLNYLLTDVEETGTLLNTINLTHSMNFTSIKANLSTSFSYTSFKGDQVKNTSLGPTLSLTKRFLDGKLPFNMAYSLLSSDNMNTKALVNILRIGTGFRYKKHHSLKLNSNLSFRAVSTPEEDKKISESRVNISYSYSF